MKHYQQPTRATFLSSIVFCLCLCGVEVVAEGWVDLEICLFLFLKQSFKSLEKLTKF